MYLTLPHKEAEKRNREAGEAMELKGTSIYIWSVIVGDTLTAIDVKDGDGLTEDEFSECAEDIPKDLVKNWN